MHPSELHQGGELTIRVSHAKNVKMTSGIVRRQERAWSSGYRNVNLPEGVDSAAISARLLNGVLFITIPKAAGYTGGVFKSIAVM